WTTGNERATGSSRFKAKVRTRTSRIVSTDKTIICRWSATELYRQGVRSTPPARKTTNAQQMEMNTYGIKILNESETVSKFPRSITAIIVANATRRTSNEIRVKRRNVL